MEQRLGPALVELNELLEKASIQFALIGGLAVAAWGVIRATQDIAVGKQRSYSARKHNAPRRVERFSRSEWLSD